MSAQRPPEGSGDADGARHRVLVVSADMGAGHHATAAALEEQVRRRWPGSTIRRVDALDLMGVGRLFRSIYVVNVERTPWLYEFFYSSLWRHRWFAHASKRFTGSWCGRRLVRVLEEFEPDLVLSTYPLGSSGLAWLRRHRGLAVPTGAWVSDFSPHPFWVYAELDATVVLHETAAVTARAAEPSAQVLVGPPPVLSSFRPDETTMENSTPRPCRILVSCGSYSFGNTTELVQTLVAASPQVHVVAVTGRDVAACRRLQALGHPPDRLEVLGWVDDMPTLLRRTDLVVTNAGGATALEALASGVPVLMYDPIAAHGRANADLMVVSGLAELVGDPAHLADYVRAIVRDPSAVDALRMRIREHLDRSDLADPLAALTEAADFELPPAWRRHLWPLRSSDRLFAAVDTGAVRQELGVVAELVGATPPALAAVQAQLAQRVRRLPALRRRLVGSQGWQQEQDIAIERHVSEVVLEPPGAGGEAGRDRVLAAVGEFWSEPLPMDRPPWQARLIRLADGPLGTAEDSGESGESGEVEQSGESGESEEAEPVSAVIAFKLHHAVADGISALTLLDSLLSPPPEPIIDKPASIPRQNSGGLHQGPAGLRQNSAALRQLICGLASLAAQGTAPRQPLSRSPGPDRQVVTWTVDLVQVRSRANAYGAKTSELALTLVVEALGELLVPAGLLRPDRPLRTMIPIALRPARLDRYSGNWTGALASDLPVQPMEFGERLSRVRAELARRAARGEAQAGQLVIRLAGRLPGPLFSSAARFAYSSRFFHTVVSYLPGPSQPRRLAGARLSTLCPVLPLAPGVPITAAAVTFGTRLCIGVTLDPGLGIGDEEVRSAFRAAWRGATATSTGAAAPELATAP